MIVEARLCRVPIHIGRKTTSTNAPSERWSNRGFKTRGSMAASKHAQLSASPSLPLGGTEPRLRTNHQTEVPAAQVVLSEPPSQVNCSQVWWNCCRKTCRTLKNVLETTRFQA